MPTYEVEAIVKLTIIAESPDDAIEKAENELDNVCSDVNITGAM
ncbi:hypothetical protein UFOVP1264_61 [uncultured Caudovirales phage]|uniref:Uncharacterized protein n=1 Tax=uncultured Caudovirales phage TaxID=2100421 RepID=A0A6J5RJV3_9CAUD|nr:hypothetical protein UFOVP1264_61 [uncultured Caudovirales phage]